MPTNPTPELVTWEETRYYDMIADCDMIRFTGFSGYGSYWLAEPAASAGRSRRAQKERVLDAIEDAIKAEAEPGEVTEERTAAARLRKQKRMMEAVG